MKKDEYRTEEFSCLRRQWRCFLCALCVLAVSSFLCHLCSLLCLIWDSWDFFSTGGFKVKRERYIFAILWFFSHSRKFIAQRNRTFEVTRKISITEYGKMVEIRPRIRLRNLIPALKVLSIKEIVYVYGTGTFVHPSFVCMLYSYQPFFGNNYNKGRTFNGGTRPEYFSPEGQHLLTPYNILPNTNFEQTPCFFKKIDTLYFTSTFFTDDNDDNFICNFQE